MLRRSRFVSIAAAAAAAPAAARAQSAAGGTTIRVGTAPNDTAAEVYYAADMGFLKAAGLNVEVATLTNGATIAQAVAGGALDAGGTNTVGLATAIARGIGFTALAGGGIYSSDAPTTALCVAKNAPFKTAKELEGQTVSVPALRDMTYAACVSWLDQNGADTSKVKFVEIPFVQAPAALEHGTVAAAMIAEPSLSAGERTTTRLFAKAFDAVAKSFMITLWFASTDFAKRNPDGFRRLASALYEAGRWANASANRERSAEILAAYTKMDRETVRTMTRATYAESFDAKLVQPALDAAYRFKLIERPMTAGELSIKA